MRDRARGWMAGRWEDGWVEGKMAGQMVERMLGREME